METNPVPSNAQSDAAEEAWTASTPVDNEPREEWMVDLHTQRVVRSQRRRSRGAASNLPTRHA